MSPPVNGDAIWVNENYEKGKSGVRYAFNFPIRSAESDGQQVASASKSVVGLTAARCLVRSKRNQNGNEIA